MTTEAEVDAERAAMLARWEQMTVAIRESRKPVSPEATQEMADIEARLRASQIPLPDNVLPFERPEEPRL